MLAFTGLLSALAFFRPNLSVAGFAASEDLTLPLPESPHHNALIMKPGHFYCVPRRLSQVPWILILGNRSLSTSLAFPRVASL